MIFYKNIQKNRVKIKKIIDKIKCLKVKAMYTIEMSILFPIVLFVIIGGIYLAFYVHDVTVARAMIAKYCNEAAGQMPSSDDIAKGVKESITNQMILGQINSIKSSKNSEQITVVVNINYDIVFWNINKVESINVVFNDINSPNYIRKVQVIIDEIENLIK